MARVTQEVRDLVKMSRAVGGDGTLVQGGGGNTSAKTADGGTMWVKASGTTLKAMTTGVGLREINLSPVLELLRDASLLKGDANEIDTKVRQRLGKACLDERRGLPSVETPLHALLSRYVVHVHPSATNGLLCAKGGRAAIEGLFADDAPPILYMPWKNPGMPLARAMASGLRAYERRNGRQPEIMFLQNHGIFLNADDPRRPVALARQVDRRVRAHWKRAHASLRPAMLGKKDAARVDRWVRKGLRAFYAEHLNGRPTIAFTDKGAHVREFVSRDDAGKLLNCGPLTPDHLAYARGAAFWVDPADGPEGMRDALAKQLVARRKRQSSVPRTVAVKGVGLYAAELSAKLRNVALSVSAASMQTLLVAADFGGPKGMSRDGAAFIEGWEYEEIRRQVATGKGA